MDADQRATGVSGSPAWVWPPPRVWPPPIAGTAWRPNASSSEKRQRGARIFATVMGVLVIVAGVAVIILHHHLGHEGDANRPEGWYASIGFGAPFIAVGVLSVLGSVLRAPWLWWSAGIAVSIPCMVSIVLFPLSFFGLALIVLGATGSTRATATVATSVLGALFPVLLISAFMYLVLHQDPRQWDTGGTSNIVTNTEATISIGVSLIVIVTATLVANKMRQSDFASSKT